MSKVIPIGGLVNLSWGRVEFVEIPGGGVVKKRESPDFRSPEVGISVNGVTSISL